MHTPKILIVDDEPFNVDYLEQELEDLDYITLTAFNGQEALNQVADERPDLVLLDIMMPLMDGFEVLEQLKANKTWRDIPVIIISAMNDLNSVVKGIKMGAEDYLPKPFNEILLKARIEACLEKKRFRDQEVEYLRQVDRLTEAAAAVEADTFDPETLSDVAARPDSLGQLTRLFQLMAREFQRREQQLKQQVQQLQIEVDKVRLTQEVNKITGTDYFRQLRDKASDLRNMLEGDERA
jgi:DNA-binding response OmpR family regulator